MRIFSVNSGRVAPLYLRSKLRRRRDVNGDIPGYIIGVFVALKMPFLFFQVFHAQFEQLMGTVVSFHFVTKESFFMDARP